MATNDLESTKQTLADLNQKIGDMEQKQGEEAHLFFKAHLADQLIFRRASGKVVGKSGPEGFLDSRPCAARTPWMKIGGARSETGPSD